MSRALQEWCTLIHEEAVSKGFWSNPCEHTGSIDVERGYKWCVDCGAYYDGTKWFDPMERHNNRPRPEQYALFISEIMEAFEEFRKPGNPDAYVLAGERVTVDPLGLQGYYPKSITDGAMLKPEGELIECVDLMIRLLDDVGHTWGWDTFEAAMEWKFAYNKTRSFRHGGKKA